MTGGFVEEVVLCEVGERVLLLVVLDGGSNHGHGLVGVQSQT